MLYLILFLFLLAIPIGSGLMAGWSDLKGMTIPNTIPVLVVISFFAAFGLTSFAGVDVFFPIKQHLYGTLGVFLVTFVIFIIGAAGAGDSKLATAFALWVGLKGLPVFLFYMALAGGVLAIVAKIIQAKKPFTAPAEGSWVARLQGGESVVPYGIPIVIGVFVTFFYLGYMDLENLKLFLVPEPE